MRKRKGRREGERERERERGRGRKREREGYPSCICWSMFQRDVAEDRVEEAIRDYSLNDTGSDENRFIDALQREVR